MLICSPGQFGISRLPFVAALRRVLSKQVTGEEEQNSDALIL